MNGYVDYNLSLKRSWLKSRERHRNQLKSISTRKSQIDNTCPKFFGKSDRISCSAAKLPSLILPLNHTVSRRSSHCKKRASTKFKRMLERRVQTGNEKLALAIALTKPTISVEKLAQDFHDSRKYKQLSSRPHLFDSQLKPRSARPFK